MSSYSEGQIHQLADALELAGYTPSDVTSLGQSAQVHLGLIKGTHRRVEVDKNAIDPLLDFFETRKGLIVYHEFKKYIIDPALEKLKVLPAKVGMQLDLPKNMMDDTEIGKMLGENHVFENAKAFCYYLKATLENQWDGTSEDLLNNGNANIFYVRGLNEMVFVVHVIWKFDTWHVHATDPKIYRRENSGSRAFSCSNSVASSAS